MTRLQLLTKLAQTRARKINLTWAQFAGVVSNTDAATKTQILSAANNGNGKVVATVINTLVAQTKYDLARAEVDAMALDDSITVDELISLLG